MAEMTVLDEESDVERLRRELAKAQPSKRRRMTEKFVLAALGSIPWVGGFLSAAYEYKSEESDLKQDTLQTQWLEEHQGKLVMLQETLVDIEGRFEALGNTVDERLQTPEYLGLVRKAFRTWDEAATEEKRRYIANLIANAAGTRVCSDDVVRLFIDWIDAYHEAHFAVIKEIYQFPTSSRADIWSAVYGDFPREDSAEADLYKLLIRDLSTGGVIRQERETNLAGQFLRKRPQPARKNHGATTMESAFEASKPYVLTELGKQFVHYTMNEVVTRVGFQSDEAG